MMSPGSSFLLGLLLLLRNLHIEANSMRNGCSVAGEQGVTIDILSCGIQNLASCTNPGKMVPVTTVALADCWGTSTLLMRCHRDGYWRTEGAQEPDGLDPDTSYTEAQPMKHLCQPFHINSSVCGRKPRYKSSGSTIHHGHVAVHNNRWPMVVGLKKKERYECSATIITPRFLLTAAHCVIISQESPDMHEDVRNLKVQLSNFNDQFVAEVYIHPDYEPGQKPVNDLAIIRLDTPLRFNDKLYPACVDLVGHYIDPFYNAVTFSRLNGKNRHEYDEILQQADTSCQGSSARCQTMKIRDTQFCSVDLATNRRLVGGSSGGPFMLNLGSDDSEEWSVSGVVSFITEHHACDQAHTIFTAINSFSTWITSIVHSNIPIKLPTSPTSATFPTTSSIPTTTTLTTTTSSSTTTRTPTVALLMPGLHPSGSHSCGVNSIPMRAYQIQMQMLDGSVQMHHYLVCSEVASTYRDHLTGVATTRTASCPATAPLYAGFDRGVGPCAPLASGWRMTTTCKNGDNQGRLPASVPVNHIRYIGCLGLNDDTDYAITEYIASGSGFREELQQVKCCKVVPS